MRSFENVFEIKNETELQKILDLVDLKTNEDIEEVKSRFRSDFKKSLYKAYFYDDNSTSKALMLISFSYSTWQHRTLTINNIYFDQNFKIKEIEKILISFRDYLFKYARENSIKRINCYTRNDSELSNILAKLGAVDLTTLEDWHIFQLDKIAMNNFANKINASFSNDHFKIVKVKDMKDYASKIRSLIRELAVYEKLEDQFQATSEELERDYDPLNRFYESYVVLDYQKNECIGFAIYFWLYNIEKGGIGCYLEDLYIKEEYRNKGLGSMLWNNVVQDALENYDVQYMNWSVLGWNKSAIEFYFKFDSRDITQEENVYFLRFTSDKIYDV
jgi:diamine N-acetyltransferase